MRQLLCEMPHQLSVHARWTPVGLIVITSIFASVTSTANFHSLEYFKFDQSSLLSHEGHQEIKIKGPVNTGSTFSTRISSAAAPNKPAVLDKTARIKAQKKLEKAIQSKPQAKLDAIKKQVTQHSFPESSMSLFETKHTLRGLGTSGSSGSSSFDALSKNPKVGIEHLLDLNRKLFDGDVLPFSPADVDKWLTNAHKKSLTIVDTHPVDLTSAILHTKNNPSIVIQNANGDTLTNDPEKGFWTESPQKTSSLSFEKINDANGNVEGVKVYIEKYETRVQIALDQNGKLTHLEQFDRTASASEKKYLGTLTRHDLETQASLNQQFYDKAVPLRQRVDSKGRERKVNQWVLDTNSKSYVKPQISELPDAATISSSSSSRKASSSQVCPGGRRRRSVGSSCVVFTRPFEAGDTKTVPEVEEIDGKKLIAEYDGIDSRSKHDLAELTKQNKDKLYTDDTETTKKVSKLIEYEDMKTHSSKVAYSKSLHANGDIPSVSTVPRVPDFSSPSSLMKNTKISQSKFARSVAAFGASEFGSNEITNPTGKFLQAKNVIKGIQSEDYATLGITAAKIGLDLGIDKAISHGTKVFEATGIMSKFTKVVGKSAGPFSTAVDEGFSVYGIVKAVGRQINPNATKFERNGAIEDAVQDAVDIAVTTAVTLASSAFPPFAPVFATIGVVANGVVANLVTALAVGLSSNHVDSLEENIPLLDFERRQEYWRPFFGQDTSHYLESLIFTKTANNLATAHHEETLKNNSDLLGVVFPSRSFSVSPDCNFFVRACETTLFSWCLVWTQFAEIGYNCHLNGECSGEYPKKLSRQVRSTNNIISTLKEHLSVCRNQDTTFEKETLLGRRIITECRCNNQSNTTWGFPHTNSEVDFTRKLDLWPQRDIPDNLKHSEFKCRPNTESDMGYQHSNRSTKFEYKCTNAIAIIDPSRTGKRGKYFSIQLGDGNDEVRMDGRSKDSNVFQVEDGHKTFSGGRGVDQFVIQGKCESLSGTLDGGDGQDDSLVILNSCAADQILWINSTSRSTMTMGTKDIQSDVSLEIKNVEAIVGRKGLSDHVTVTCTTRSLVPQGGSSAFKPDEISIPRNSQSCPYNLAVQVQGHTKITSQATHGNVTIAVKKTTEASFTAEITAQKNSSTSTRLFFDIASFEIQFLPEKSSKAFPSIYSFSFKNFLNNQSYSVRYNLGRFDSWTPQEINSNRPQMFLKEPVGQHSILGTDEHGSPQVIHQLTLQTESDSRNLSHRKGSQSSFNHFHLVSGFWRVEGSFGNNDDFTFYPEFSGIIDGKGGFNCLRVVDSISTPVNIYYMPIPSNDKDKPSIVPSGNGTLYVFNFERISGRPGAQESLTLTKPFDSHCLKSLVISLGGGSSKYAPDTIQIQDTFFSNELCSPDLKIIVLGYTQFNMQLTNIKSMKSQAIFVLQRQDQLDFQSQVVVVNNDETVGETSLFIYYIQLQLATLTELNLQQIFTNKSLAMQLKFQSHQQVSLSFENIPRSFVPEVLFLEGSEVIAQLVLYEGVGFIVQSLGKPDTNEKTVRHGAFGVPNHFYMNGGEWDVAGGQRDDTFNLMSDEFYGTIDGGIQGANRLVLGPEFAVDRIVLVDMLKGKVETEGSSTKTNAKDIHSVLGRAGQSETIVCASELSYVDSGGGGSTNKSDLILISQDDKESLFNITVKGQVYTHIENNATSGTFKYIVNSDSASVSSQAGLNATELLQLNLPLTYLRSVYFKKTSSISGELHLKMKSGYNHSMQIPFSKPSSLKTIQIVENFNLSGVVDTSVKCDIRVKADGSIYTSIELQSNAHVKTFKDVEGVSGVENNFVVKLNQTTKLRSIVGKDEDDHIWIYSTKSADILDGGKEGSEGNSLHIFDFFFRGVDLLVDLGVNSSTGSIVSLHSKEPDAAVGSLKNFQIFHGRPNEFERVLVTCDTSFVANAEEIWITDDQCDYYNLAIQVQPGIQVHFKPHVYFEGVFVYHFHDDSISVNFQGLEDLSDSYQDEFSYSKHLFRFHSLKLAEIDKLAFNGSHLLYQKKGNLYSHAVIESPGTLEEFYPHEFVTADDYIIQITKFGKISLTLGSVWDSDAELDLIEVIQRKFVPELEATARRLGVTITVRTNTDYLTAGYIDNDDSGDVNILTNGPLRSHLIGSGSNRTVYEIVSLDSDVFIYPGPFETGSNHHILDMTDIVAALRLKTGTKYVPSVEKDEQNLVISMKHYESEFPGRVIVVNGIENADGLDLLLNTAAMQMVPVSSLNQTRRKRSLEQYEESGWILHPKVVVVPLGSVFTLSPEDLEEGHEIVTSSGEDLKDSSNSSRRNFKVVRDGNDLYMTTIGSSPSPEEWDTSNVDDEITTIVLTDYFGSEVSRDLLPGEVGDNDEHAAENRIAPKFVEVSFNLQENLTFFFNDSQIIKSTEALADGNFQLDLPVEMEELETWDELLIETETEVLKDLPEVVHSRVFQQIHSPVKYSNLLYLICDAVAFFVSTIFAVCALRRFLVSKDTEEISITKL